MVKIILLAVTLFTLSHQGIAQTPEHADTILHRAFKKAAKEHKSVLVIFHASWCGWCKKMEATLDNPACKKLFQDHYIIEYLTILEQGDKKQLQNYGAMALYEKYSKDSGIPFWLVYGADGKLIADSKMDDGNNTGCPATEKEVQYFIKVLKKSSKLDDASLKLIYNLFRKNEAKN